MKINYAKMWEAYQYRQKLPRKIKKNLLGPKLKKYKLKKLLQSVVIYTEEEAEALCAQIVQPYEFCPKCGSTRTRLISHDVTYPEVWIDVRCGRCDYLVGAADNSRMVHCLEHADFKVH